MDGDRPAKPSASAASSSAVGVTEASHGPARNDRREALLDDVALLIDYLGRHRPGRLDACFEDSRGDLSRPAGVPIAPASEAGKPPTKAGFLHRWTSIDTRAKAAPGDAVAPGEGARSQVEDLVFLVAARDFLAALAWPATVHTIRLTQAYIGEVPAPRAMVAAGATAENIDSLAGRHLRRKAKQLRIACIGLVVVTVAVSLLGFGGKRLLEEQDRWVTFLGAVANDIGAEERPATGAATTTPSGTATTVPANPEAAPPRHFAYCDNPFMDSRGAVRYASPRQEVLCNRLWGVNRTINQLNANLEAWGSYPPIAIGMLLTGLSSDGQREARVRVFAEAARPLNLREAMLLLPERNPTREEPGLASPTASDLSAARQMVDDASFEFYTRKYMGERHRDVTSISPTQAKVMIEALSLYIMPCLYALLGAFVAMFQQMKRRADAFTLDRSDAAQAIQTLVFGLVFGAIVGILADMLRSRPASGAASDEVVLGISVIALLAGYSVAHVFRFLDNFADRVFGAAPQPRQTSG